MSKYMPGFGPTFRAGDICTLQMSPEGLAVGRDRDYPLRDYHGRKVAVIAQKDAAGKTILDTYPDGEGLVDVILPKSFKRGGREVISIPVLACVLKHTGERLGKEAAAS